MIQDKPWLQGHNTIIWQVPFDQAKEPAGIGLFLIWAPWMHLLWDYHIASIVHLRPIDGEEANFQFEGATHEFIVWAGDPDHEPTALIPKQFRYLRPLSIAQQFTSENDAKALETIENLLKHVTSGRLSVDSDFRGAWHHILVQGCPEF